VLGAVRGYATGITVDSMRVWVAADGQLIGVRKERSREEVPVTIDAGGGSARSLVADGEHVYWLRASDGAIVRRARTGLGETEVVQAALGSGAITGFAFTRCGLVFEVVRTSSEQAVRTSLYRRARP
jgi:hypothetical protein